ncbi:MAG: O-antigen ligase family protein [Chloroflexales bacterium]|nr:O-antigen ligase family protein [Chloroflexales bacterium]
MKSHVLSQLAWLIIIVLLALALALLPLPTVLLLIGVSAVVILALIDPIWALYAAVLSVPVQELVHLPGGLSYTQAATLLAVGAWGLHILAHPERPIMFGRVALGLGALLWALTLSSIVTPYSQIEGLKETLRWATVALIYLLALNSLVDARGQDQTWKRRALGLVVCLLLAPSVAALVGLWQFVTASGPPSFEIAGGRFVRAYGTIGQPNSFAGYMNMAWPLAAGLLLFWMADVRSRFERYQSNIFGVQSMFIFVGLGGAAGLLLAALMSSFSRGGWVGAVGGVAGLLIAALMVLDAATRKRVWRWVGVAAGAGFLVLLLGGWGLLPAALTERVASITNNLRLFDVRTVMVTPANFAVVERMAHLQAGWRMFTGNLLTGVGPGNFTLAYEGLGDAGIASYALHPWYGSRGHTHNYYLHIAAEAGSIGLVAYGLLLALLIVQARAALRFAERWFWRGIAVGSCGIITAVVTHNLFENLHVLHMGIQLGAVWALLAAIEQHARIRRETRYE